MVCYLIGEKIMEEYNLSELGKRIKAARKAKKKTQEDVAAAIGVGKISVSLWERGLKQPGILNVFNYCNFLGIPLDELLGLEKKRIFSAEFTEEERNVILSLCDQCQRESENSHFQSKLHFLEQHLKALFGRAHTK
jgi:transcriptional regulator with XRE-family HTH domain